MGFRYWLALGTSSSCSQSQFLAEPLGAERSNEVLLFAGSRLQCKLARRPSSWQNFRGLSMLLSVGITLINQRLVGHLP